MLVLLWLSLKQPELVPLDGAFKRSVLQFLQEKSEGKVSQVFVEHEEKFQEAMLLGEFPDRESLDIFVKVVRDNPYVAAITSLKAFAPTTVKGVVARDTSLEPPARENGGGLFDFMKG